jgi:23S rRNA (pseudouridine1915-N3)-methyltransferase
MITLLAVGKKHEDWISLGLGRYSKRLKRPWNTEWVFVPHSAVNGQRARDEESETILSRLKPDDYVIVLDERGKLLDSPALSEQLLARLESSRHVVIVIGGAYGVNDHLIDRADLLWSLSPLVFPHQLVRLVLIEQLYRSQEIALGNPYHHA